MAGQERVPSTREIAKLPRWVRVAFALRCARRVLPLLRAVFPYTLLKYVIAIEHPLQRVERAYETTSADQFTLDPHVAAIEAAVEAKGAAEAISNTITTPIPTATVKVALAVVAAAEAIISAYQDEDQDVSVAAADAARAAAAAAGIVSASINATIRRDLLMLEEASTSARWTHEIRPSLRSLGPLWLEGEEPDWNEIVSRVKMPQGKQETGEQPEERLILTAYAGESVDDDTLVEGIVRLYQALNRYYIACGGSGLTLDDWQILVRAGAPEGVPA